MTDQSNMQKMHNTPGHESNVQKMHIPQEWVEAGARAAWSAGNPDNGWDAQSDETWENYFRDTKAAIAAVIPLIREDERERLAGIAEGEGRWLDEETRLDDWLRTQEGK